jgi:serine/threonine protein kinase
MFLDEARVAATLHHQHIVQVHDIGEAAGEYFIAMEYVHGEDVRKILSAASKQRTHVPLGHAVAIVSAAAAGLHYAHERRGTDMQPLNIVHRDVSPSNILVGYDGSIKVVDFGIATASMRQETRSGSLKGKLSYMSPEQCKGAVVDRRSDVYSLGVVLYELATTTRMIKGENDYLVMEQIVHGRISSPQLRRPSLPNELTEIIMRALSTDRERRFASADDLRVALDQFASSAGLTASSSAMAAYMRQQFGQRPEPWLEAGSQPIPTEGLRQAGEGSMPSGSWNELRSASNRRGSSSIAPHSGPIGVIANDVAGDATARMTAPAPATPSMASLSSSSMSSLDVSPSGVSLANTPPPTHSRLGWESQPRPSARTFPVQKAAIAGGALVAGIVIWIVASRFSHPAEPTVTAAALTAPAPPVAAVAPTPPPPPVASIPVDANTPDAEAVVITPTRSARDLDSAPVRKTRAAAAAVATRAPRTEVALPPAPKAERATRVAVTTPSEPSSRGSDAGAPEPETHRPVAPPPPAVPQPVTPPVATTTASPPPPPTPAAPVAPAVVAPAALDANRIAGEKSIVPDSTTQDAIGRAGNEKLISSFKVCVTADGTIGSVSQLKSSGFPAYDEKIQHTIRTEWRYKPYMVNGKATPVCTAFRFIYQQK